MADAHPTPREPAEPGPLRPTSQAKPATPEYVSAPRPPYERGRDFGAAHRREIARGVDDYHALFTEAAGRTMDHDEYAARCLAAVEPWAPDLAAEIHGIADGAGQPVNRIAALNARTEILARCGAVRAGECTAVVALPPASTSVSGIQHWDWYPEFADNWLTWVIEHDDGGTTRTLTEYGIVGKIGLARRGFGLLFTILHHSADGSRPGVPVHVIARHVLDNARNVTDAATIIARASAAASSSLTLFGREHGDEAAISCEVSPSGTGMVLPDEAGLLLHTNHFLAPPRDGHDDGPGQSPDTLLRLYTLGRRLSAPAAAGRLTMDGLRAALASHAGGTGALCCHPDPADPPLDRFETLATVAIDPVAGRLDIQAGGSCRHSAP